jgi:hypothetical protein
VSVKHGFSPVVVAALWEDVLEITDVERVVKDAVGRRQIPSALGTIFVSPTVQSQEKSTV